MEQTKDQSAVMRLLEKLGKRVPLPRADEVASKFIRHAGGPDGFAKLLWEEYLAADAGSLARQRIMETILRGLKGSGAVSRDQMAALTDDELTALHEQLLRDAGVLVDAAEKEAEAAADPGAPAPPAGGDGRPLDFSQVR